MSQPGETSEAMEMETSPSAQLTQSSERNVENNADIMSVTPEALTSVVSVETQLDKTQSAECNQVTQSPETAVSNEKQEASRDLLAGPDSMSALEGTVPSAVIPVLDPTLTPRINNEPLPALECDSTCNMETEAASEGKASAMVSSAVAPTDFNISSSQTRADFTGESEIPIPDTKMTPSFSVESTDSHGLQSDALLDTIAHVKVRAALSTDSTDDSVALTDSAPATDADVASGTDLTQKHVTANKASDPDTEETGSELSGFVIVRKEDTEDFSTITGDAAKEEEIEEEKKSSLSSLQHYRDRRSRPPLPNNVSDDTHDTGATDTDSDSSSDWMASSSSEMDDGKPRMWRKDPAAAVDGKKKTEDINVKTKGEMGLNELPPIEELKITVDENVTMHEVGLVSSVVNVLVIVQAKRDLPPLDSDTILFTDDKKPIGLIFETFGPVTAPFYSVRFNSPSDIEERNIEPGTHIYYAPEMEQYTHYVFTEQLKRLKGSDASWEHNNEPPPKFLDYSDDEEERRARAKMRSKDEEDEEEDDQQESIGKKKKKRKPRKKQLNGYVADISDSDGFQSADASGGTAMQWPPTGASQWRPPPRPTWSPWSSSPRNHPSYRNRPGQEHRSRFEGPRERCPGGWAPRPVCMPRAPPQRGPPPNFFPPGPPPPPAYGPPPQDYGHRGPSSGPYGPISGPHGPNMGPPHGPNSGYCMANPAPPMDMRYVQNARPETFHQGDAGPPNFNGSFNGPPYPGAGPPPPMRMPPPPQFGGNPCFPSGPQHHF